MRRLFQLPSFQSSERRANGFGWKTYARSLQISRLSALFIFALLASSYCKHVFALEIVIDKHTPEQLIGLDAEYFTSSDKDHTIESILNEISDEQWLKSEKASLSFGYGRAPYWFRMDITNPYEETHQRYLEVGYPVLDHINVYFVQNNQVLESRELGDKLPFHERPVEHRNFLIPIELKSKETLEIYLRIESSSSIQVPLTLWEKENLFESDQLATLGMGLYYGTMLIMIIYNLFVFISVREISYFYYVCFVTCMLVFISSLNGTTFQYLWPENVWLNDEILIFSLCGVLIFAALFTKNFLKLDDQYKILSRLLTLLIGVVFINLLVTPFINFRLGILSTITIAVTAICLGMTGGIARWRSGYSPAKFYVVAWSCIMIGGAILAMNKLAIFPRNFLTENATLIGSALEVTLLSFALADRLNVEKKQRFEAQMASLANERLARHAQETALHQEKQARNAQEKALVHEREAREAQEKALRIQKQANETLEVRVKERTEALEQANKQLETLSVTDGLTGTYNRRYFDDQVSHEFRRAIREEVDIGLVIMDIDHFKNFNDQYGHLVGDDCLKAVADCIKNQVHRDGDIIARYGGEEFVALLPLTESEGVEAVAEKIRRSVESLEFMVNNERIPITVSLGAASFHPDKDDTLAELIKRVDDALYRSKENGRNQVSIAAG